MFSTLSLWYCNWIRCQGALPACLKTWQRGIQTPKESNVHLIIHVYLYISVYNFSVNLHVLSKGKWWEERKYHYAVKWFKRFHSKCHMMFADNFPSTNWRKLSSICPVIDNEFCHNIIKVAVDPQGKVIAEWISRLLGQCHDKVHCQWQNRHIKNWHQFVFYDRKLSNCPLSLIT